MIKKQILIKLFLSVPVLCSAFFLPARTLNYWEAWVYIGITFTLAIATILYFLKNDPELLERRMRTKENLKEQKLIIRISMILFLPVFIIPGFDKYYGWSDIPLYLIIISEIMVLLGYMFVIRVFKENSYASRVVEINQGQMVISTGLYSIVRHPMYTGNLLMYGFTPIALGSYWAMTGTVFILIILIARIKSEEKFLSENLEGYKEYMEKTKYRLISGIW